MTRLIATVFIIFGLAACQVTTGNPTPQRTRRSQDAKARSDRCETWTVCQIRQAVLDLFGLWMAGHRASLVQARAAATVAIRQAWNRAWP